VTLSGGTTVPLNMEKNKLYILIFGLLFIFVILLGVVSMLSNRLQKKSNDEADKRVDTVVSPTGNFVFPTSVIASPQQDGIAPEQRKILSYTYPIKYENLIIDYLANRQQMIVYYPSEVAPAEELFKRFLSENEVVNPGDVGIKIEYIGLAKDPNEPIPGTPVE
jgi:hypothetical protein